MKKKILSAAIILGLGLSNANAQNQPISKTKKTNKMEKQTKSSKPYQSN